MTQSDFPFVIGRHGMISVLEAEKPQKNTVLPRYHFQLLSGRGGEYAYRYSMDFPLSGTSCPPFDSFQSPASAARRGYLVMHRWIRSTAPDPVKAVKDFRHWFCSNVLKKIQNHT